MKFKKIDLGQTITIFANIGVIAGIVFLAIELQQNNALLETQVRREFYENRIANASDIIRDASLADIYAKFRTGEELTVSEEIRMEQIIRRIFFNLEWEYDQYQRGQLERLPLYGWKTIFRTSGVKGMQIWENGAEGFRETSPDFVRFIEENIINDL